MARYWALQRYGRGMRLGVGGKAFGVRGGISTRGIGVGVGPLSAGTSWRGRGSRRSGGSGGGGGWLLVLVIGFFALAWPYFLGTYIAVRCGAWNPSTERLVVGWCFEVVYIAAVVALVLTAKAMRVRRLGAPMVAEPANKTAASASAPLPVGSSFRPVVAWTAAILVVGLGVGMGILAANPIHTAAGDAAGRSCPTSSGEIKMPDIIGQNAGDVEAQLKGLGFEGAALESANPSYKSVWVASNWTVVSTDPGPGCMVSRGYEATVYVTK